MILTVAPDAALDLLHRLPAPSPHLLGRHAGAAVLARWALLGEPYSVTLPCLSHIWSRLTPFSLSVSWRTSCRVLLPLVSVT